MSNHQDPDIPVITPRENASLRVDRLRTLIDGQGRPISTANRGKGNIALCRCGASGIKPFCDGSHKKTDFRSARLVEPTPRPTAPARSDSIDGKEPRAHESEPAITINAAGPYRVSGGVALDIDDDDWPEGMSRERYALCRCGHSKSKPFCDGTHGSVDFDDPGLDTTAATD